MFLPKANLSTCVQADWGTSLDRATWSTCPKTNTFLRGLWRNQRQPGDERVGRIEYGSCCPASEPSYANQTATCSNANWLYILDGWVILKKKQQQQQEISKGNSKIEIWVAGMKHLEENVQVLSVLSEAQFIIMIMMSFFPFIVGGWNINIIEAALILFLCHESYKFPVKVPNAIFLVFQLPNNTALPL